MTTRHILGAAFAIGLAAAPAMAERINLASDAAVDASVARLTEAVTDARAKIFAVVDFAQGSASVGASLRPTTVVIFGRPGIGAAALQAGRTFTLYLPLRILFFEDASGQTWLTYDDPGHVAPPHGVAAHAPAVRRMQAAMSRLAAIAAGG